MRNKITVVLEIFATILLATLCVCVHILNAEEVSRKSDAITRSADTVRELIGSKVPEYFNSDRSVIVSDIKELTRRSTAIIIGRPLASKSFYDEKTDEARTLHLLLVQTVFKGKVENGITIELEMPGGVYVGQDGVTGIRLASDMRKMRDSASYFIFIKESDNEDGRQVYRPSLGVQGIFEIDSETNAIIPCDMLRSSPVVKRYENASVEDFMNELMTALSAESSQ